MRKMCVWLAGVLACGVWAAGARAQEAKGADGKWIAFLSDRPPQLSGSPADKQQIYVIPADGGEAQQATKAENDVSAFDWAPDSKRIAFSMSDPEPKAMKDRKDKYGEYVVVR